MQEADAYDAFLNNNGSGGIQAGMHAAMEQQLASTAGRGQEAGAGSDDDDDGGGGMGNDEDEDEVSDLEWCCSVIYCKGQGMCI